MVHGTEGLFVAVVVTLYILWRVPWSATSSGTGGASGFDGLFFPRLLDAADPGAVDQLDERPVHVTRRVAINFGSWTSHIPTVEQVPTRSSCRWPIIWVGNRVPVAGRDPRPGPGSKFHERGLRTRNPSIGFFRLLGERHLRRFVVFGPAVGDASSHAHAKLFSYASTVPSLTLSPAPKYSSRVRDGQAWEFATYLGLACIHHFRE